MREEEVGELLTPLSDKRVLPHLLSLCHNFSTSRSPLPPSQRDIHFLTFPVSTMAWTLNCATFSSRTSSLR